MTKNNDIKQFWLGGKHTVNHASKMRIIQFPKSSYHQKTI